MEEKLKRLKEEIRDLKTASRVGSNLVASYKEFTVNFSTFPNGPSIWQITYESGDQPIISYCYMLSIGRYLLGGAIFEEPNGTTQKVAINIVDAGTSGNSKFIIISTRAIQSITRIS